MSVCACVCGWVGWWEEEEVRVCVCMLSVQVYLYTWTLKKVTQIFNSNKQISVNFHSDCFQPQEALTNSECVAACYHPVISSVSHVLWALPLARREHACRRAVELATKGPLGEFGSFQIAVATTLLHSYLREIGHTYPHSHPVSTVPSDRPQCIHTNTTSKLKTTLPCKGLSASLPALV